MPARTLSQAIDQLAGIASGFERPAGPVLEPLFRAVDVVGESRRRLDGLEEDRAVLDVRNKAFERASELVVHQTSGDLGNEEHLTAVLEVARFLAPGWAELERVDIHAFGTEDPVRTVVTDPGLEERETRAELEASQAGAEALADQLRDQLHRAEEERDEALIIAEERNRDREQAYAKVAELEAEVDDLKTWRNAAKTLNPLFGGPHINDELEDLDTVSAGDITVDEDDPGIVHFRGGRAYTLEAALVIASRIVEAAQHRASTEGLFAAIYRKVIHA